MSLKSKYHTFVSFIKSSFCLGRLLSTHYCYKPKRGVIRFKCPKTSPGEWPVLTTDEANQTFALTEQLQMIFK